MEHIWQDLVYCDICEWFRYVFRWQLYRFSTLRCYQGWSQLIWSDQANLACKTEQNALKLKPRFASTNEDCGYNSYSYIAICIINWYIVSTALVLATGSLIRLFKLSIQGRLTFSITLLATSFRLSLSVKSLCTSTINSIFLVPWCFPVFVTYNYMCKYHNCFNQPTPTSLKPCDLYFYIT